METSPGVVWDGTRPFYGNPEQGNSPRLLSEMSASASGRTRGADHSAEPSSAECRVSSDEPWLSGALPAAVDPDSSFGAGFPAAGHPRVARRRHDPSSGNPDVSPVGGLPLVATGDPDVARPGVCGSHFGPVGPHRGGRQGPRRVSPRPPTPAH